MANCPNCGRPVPEGATTCPACGNPLPPSGAPEPLMQVDTFGSLSRLGFFALFLMGLGFLLGAVGTILVPVSLATIPGLVVTNAGWAFIGLTIAVAVMALLAGIFGLLAGLRIRRRYNHWRTVNLIALFGALVVILLGVRGIALDLGGLGGHLASGVMGLVSGVFLILAWVFVKSAQPKVRFLGGLFVFVALGLWVAAVVAQPVVALGGGFLPSLYQPYGVYGSALGIVGFFILGVLLVLDPKFTARGRPLRGILLGVAGIILSVDFVAGFLGAAGSFAVAGALGTATTATTIAAVGLSLVGVMGVMFGIAGVLGIIASILWIVANGKALERNQPIEWFVAEPVIQPMAQPVMATAEAMPATMAPVATPPAAQPAASSGFCTKCGAVRVTTAAFCPNCGAKY